MSGKTKISPWIMRQKSVKKAIRRAKRESKRLSRTVQRAILGANAKYGWLPIKKNFRLVNQWQDYILDNIPDVFEDLPITIKTHIDEKMDLAKAHWKGLMSQTNLNTSIDVLNELIEEERNRLFPEIYGEDAPTGALWIWALAENYWAHLCRQNESNDVADETIDEVRNLFAIPGQRRRGGR